MRLQAETNLFFLDMFVKYVGYAVKGTNRRLGNKEIAENLNISTQHMSFINQNSLKKLPILAEAYKNYVEISIKDCLACIGSGAYLEGDKKIYI